jgi:murein L,D-transpeptidase YafK
MRGWWLAGVVVMLAGTARAADPCAGRGTSLLVRTAEHLLFRCEGGRAVARYPVALGRGGVGKLKEGDGRTPLGTYPLGAPRPSAKFGTFIPVAYPTPEQRKRGFTGGAVGVHGPSAKLAWLAELDRLIDWTQGCIALATRAQIDEVAAWVKRARPTAITLE